MSPWPPSLPPNATWADVAALQLRPWALRGSIDVDALLLETTRMRSPPAAGPVSRPAATLVDTASWSMQHIGARWLPHHTIRLRALLNIFRLAQQRARASDRPLPRIRFVVISSDGHGLHTNQFNNSCTCTSEKTCCDPQVDAPAAEAPAAPSFATLFCRHAYDVSVPSIINDLLDTSSAASIEASVRKWLAIGAAQPWEGRERRAFFVGDDKAYRAAAIRHGRAREDLFRVHRARSTNAAERLPFAEHAKYKAVVYAHGFHFNSVRWRRLALLGGAVIAPESPCKEWWQLLAQPWVHYAPTSETFADVADSASKLLEPGFDDAAQQMAGALRTLAVRAFSSEGLLDYVEALWRAYAALQKPLTPMRGPAPEDMSTLS